MERAVRGAGTIAIHGGRAVVGGARRDHEGGGDDGEGVQGDVGGVGVRGVREA